MVISFRIMNTIIKVKTNRYIMKFLNKPTRARISKIACISLIMLSGILTISAQISPKIDSPLVGSWVIDQAQSFDRILPEDKEILDTTPQLNARVQADYINRKLEFHPDGGFIQIDRAGTKVEGTWQLDGRILTIISLKGNVWPQEIVFLDRTKLILRQMNKGDAKPIFPELHLNRL